MEVRPSTLNFLSFFLNNLTSYTEIFDNVNVVNITKVVDITREEGDRMEVGDIK